MISFPFFNMSKLKDKELRKNFNDACLKRDKYSCVMCNFKSSPEMASTELDVHHIINRHEIVNNGYVKENGISLCEPCHMKAESHWIVEQSKKSGKWTRTVAEPGFSPLDLFEKINSSEAVARAAAEKL